MGYSSYNASLRIAVCTHPFAKTGFVLNLLGILEGSRERKGKIVATNVHLNECAKAVRRWQ